VFAFNNIPFINTAARVHKKLTALTEKEKHIKIYNYSVLQSNTKQAVI
jgi:hypothetical protein